ncbi:enoyl-CoA hydratase/isomerase family protein [Noviherbaspirillum saxi]|nr:enoyl-CoA hydratase/isomerase family protein [Noviherbaspirillum saxi]
MSDESPSLECVGATATILLQRPREHNRIDPDDIAVIRSHLDNIQQRSDIRVVVFSGRGDKTFSSGYTIQALVEKLDRNFEELLDAVENYPLPTICALNGSVYGGATDLALCCDVRIGVRNSRMFMPAAKFGLHYYPGGLRRYVAQLGPSETKRLFLTAAAIDDEEMLRIGFLNELVEREQLPAKVREYADAIAACEPHTVISLKRQINAIAAAEPSAATFRDDYERSLRSEAFRLRVNAVAKRE